MCRRFLPTPSWLDRTLVLTSWLYHCIHQRLRQRPQEFQGLARSFDVGVHLLAGYVQHLPLRSDERLGCLTGQLGQLGLLDFLNGGAFATSGLGCLLGDDIQELLLGFDKILHTLAGQVHQRRSTW